MVDAQQPSIYLRDEPGELYGSVYSNERSCECLRKELIGAERLK